MNMPFYVAPEQVMKDRADYARKGIARTKPGRVPVRRWCGDLCRERIVHTPQSQ